MWVCWGGRIQPTRWQSTPGIPTSHSVVPAHYRPQVARSRKTHTCVGTESKSENGKRGRGQHHHLPSGLLFFTICLFCGWVCIERIHTHVCVHLWRSEKCMRSPWSSLQSSRQLWTTGHEHRSLNSGSLEGQQAPSCYTVCPSPFVSETGTRSLVQAGL